LKDEKGRADTSEDCFSLLADTWTSVGEGEKEASHAIASGRKGEVEHVKEENANTDPSFLIYQASGDEKKKKKKKIPGHIENPNLKNGEKSHEREKGKTEGDDGRSRKNLPHSL